MIAIIDYGAGNLRSVEKAFQAVGVAVQVSSDAGLLSEAEKLVLPGVGAFGDAMEKLRAAGLDKLVQRAAQEGKPILGICVGLQLFFDEGFEFGRHQGLGLLRGRVVRFPENGIRIPQVGWNQVELQRPSPLFNGIEDRSFFYFVHSYYTQADAEEDILGITEYGIRYASVCARGRIFGVQFHPEKSQDNGLRLLKNFAELI